MNRHNATIIFASVCVLAFLFGVTLVTVERAQVSGCGDAFGRQLVKWDTKCELSK